MNATDALFERLHEQWLEDPEAIEDPLLARAFQEINPDEPTVRTLEASQKRLQALLSERETDLERLRGRVEDLEMEISREARIETLEADLQATGARAQTEQVALVARIAALETELRELSPKFVRYAPGELENLEGSGIRKDIG